MLPSLTGRRRTQFLRLAPPAGSEIRPGITHSAAASAVLTTRQ
jgi:hypothetical protein